MRVILFTNPNRGRSFLQVEGHDHSFTPKAVHEEIDLVPYLHRPLFACFYEGAF